MREESIRSPDRRSIVTSAYIFIISAMCVFAIACFRLGEQRYAIYRAGYDDGIFMQVLASAFHGFHAAGEGNVDHLAVHFSPILFLISPIVIAAHSAVALIAIQSVAGAATALPIFLIARKRMPIVVAAGCAAITLLYLPLVGVMTGDFHEHAFTPVTIAWTLWSVDAKKIWATASFGVLSLCIKEDVSVTFAIDGIAAAWWFRRRHDPARARLALALGIGGLTTATGYAFVVLPLIHAPFHYWSLHFYFSNGATTSPAGFVGLTDPVKFRYLVTALGPLCFLPLLSPAVLLCVPGLLEVLASREAITMHMGTQYAAVWIPFMLVAFVLGLARVMRRSVRIGLWLALLAALVSRHMVLVDDPFARWYSNFRLVDDDDRTVDRFLASQPPDVDMGVLYDVYAHAGTDPNVSIFHDGTRYILLDTLHESADTDKETQLVDRLLANGTYVRRKAPRGLVFIERRHP